MSSFTRVAWFGGVALAAVLAFTAFLGDARGQAFNVNDFSCSATPFGVHVDVSGLGHTDICVIGAADINLNCACAGGGGNCTSDAKKNTFSTTASTSQDVQPKNGRVDATVTIPFSATNSQCAAALSCPSGQTAKLVSFAASEDFQLCTAGPPTEPGQACSCAKELDMSPITCASSGTPFPGKKNSCSALF